MKKPIIRSAALPTSGFAVSQRLSVPISLSVIGHLVFFLLCFLLPKVSFDSNRPAHYINVQLVSASAPMPVAAPAAEEVVSLPASSSPEPAPQPEAASAPAVQPQAASTRSTQDAVSLAKPQEIEKKQSMKKRTYKRERVMESAIKNVEKQVTATETDQKQQALDQIRSAVAAQAAQEPGTSESSTAATDRSGLWGEGKTSTDIERIYTAEVAFHIKKNWAFSEQMAGGEKNLTNEVVIRIARSGDIDEIWFDRRSGNSYFDDSTYKAILKSSPLPTIPDEIQAPLTLGFRFNPDGLK